MRKQLLLQLQLRPNDDAFASCLLSSGLYPFVSGDDDERDGVRDTAVVAVVVDGGNAVAFDESVVAAVDIAVVVVVVVFDTLKKT